MSYETEPMKIACRPGRRALAMACLIGIGACNTASPRFCDSHPTDPSCVGPAVDAGSQCMANTDCTAPTAVCDTGTSTCVECTATDLAACSGTMPVCGDDETCRGCTAHTDCASAACLPDGSCASESQVAYVDPGGSDNTTCSLTMPCTKVANALATDRVFVKFHGTTAEQVTLTDVAVTWLADPGAVLKLPTDGPLVLLQGATNLRIFDLSLTGAASASTGTGTGISMPGSLATLALTRVTVSNNLMGGIVATAGQITISDSTFLGNQGGGLTMSSGTASVTASTFMNNQGGGLVASSSTVNVSDTTFAGNVGGGVVVNVGSTLTMDASTLTGNDLGLAARNGVATVSRSRFSGNTSGGIDLTNEVFTLIGNVLFANGSSTTSVGGIAISSTAPNNSSNRLEFNSFTKNLARTGVGPAIQCTATNFTARDNILSDNGLLDQVGGSCAYTYSIIRPGVLPSGTGNLAAEPLFVNESAGDLHIQTASPARGAADPAAVLTGVAATDIDGDVRIAPADIGADQFKP